MFVAWCFHNIIHNMKNNIIVKKNELLKVKYSLTLNEQRLLLACMSQIDSRKPLLPNYEFVITVQEFADLFDDRHKNTYHNLVLACDKLWKSDVFLKDAEGVEKYHWVKKVKYWHDESKVRLVFSDEVIPYLSSISEKFFKYKLADVKDFQSVYSLRFYELLHQFQAGGSGSQEIEVDELRRILNLEDKYATFGELKRSVIDKAISEINQYSNLTVSYGERKRGRRVVAIQFAFETKQKVQAVEQSTKQKTLTLEQFVSKYKKETTGKNEFQVRQMMASAKYK